MLSRASAPIWAFLLLVLCLVPSLSQVVLAQHSIQDLSQQPLITNSKPSAEQKAHYLERGGNDIIHEIWSVLRDYEPTWKDSVTNIPPSGMAENIWYYTKVILRALFMNSPTRNDGDETPIIRGDLKNAVETLKLGASYEDPDAIFLLAEMNFFGNFSHPRNFQAAFRRYEQLADLNGNGTAQHMLGLMYATGIGGGVEQDQAKALLYHTFAAEQGEVKSEMTLAFRYHSGIGTGRDCNKAAEYYKRVADKSMDWWLSGPPGGHLIQRNAARWVEFDGGLYGEGASVSSSGHLAYKDNTILTNVDDLMEFYDLRGRQGDWTAVMNLALYYYEPPRGYRRNLRKAQRHFMRITRAYWGKDGKVLSKPARGIDKLAGKAAAYVGRIFLRGEGVDQNFEKAITWFKRGVANGDPFAQYHLGLMYRDGLGVPRDGAKAASYLKAASEQSLAIAQSALGVLFLDQGDVETAHRYFERAASGGVIEGYYYLAELTNKGVGRERNCGLSVAYYKVVAEKAELLHTGFMEANLAFERDDLERAFVASLMAAEQGYEHAQSNVAFLLDEQASVISLPSLPLLANPLSATSKTGQKRSKLLTNPAMALVYLTRSAKQANVDSLVKMGDYYLAGIEFNASELLKPVSSSASPPAGTDGDTKSRDTNLDRASSCYTTAAESHHSSQAFWKLGWMHENGIGPIPQDFHMAKRYYDLSLEMTKEAYLPVKLALIKLRLRSWWNGISGGKINGIKDEKDSDGPKTFTEWFRRFIDATREREADEYNELLRQQAEGVGDMDLDGVGGLGETGMPGADADYYYHNNHDGGPEGEYLDGDIDDGLVESLIIIALAGALAMLVYARQQRQRDGGGARDRAERDRRQREERDRNNNNPNVDGGVGEIPAGMADIPPEQQQQPIVDDAQQAPGPDGGFFPGFGDPEFANWAVGGIGH